MRRSFDRLSLSLSLDQSGKIQKGGKSGHVHVASNRRVLFTVVLDSESGASGESAQCLSALDSWPIRLVFVLEIEPAGRASHRRYNREWTVNTGHCYRTSRESPADRGN